MEQAVAEEGFDAGRAKALDIQRAPAGEMAQPFDPLRRTDQPAGAAHVDLAFLAHRIGLAFGAKGGEGPGAAAFVARQILDDLGNDVAGALKHDPVAGPHVQPRDLMLVVQRRVGDDNTAHRHRGEPRHRGQLAGAADLDVDPLERGLGAFRRELVGQRPPWRLGHRAKPCLPVEPVDLVDNAVDIERQVGARRLDLAILLQCPGDALDPYEHVADRDSPGRDRPDHVILSRARYRGHLAPAMGEEAQRTARGDGGILLAQRSCRCVARIGELAGLAGVAGCLRLGEQPGVERGEIGLGHIDLAPYFEHIGGLAMQVLRDIGDRPHIGGHVLADLAVPPGECLNQLSALVAQRAGQAVDLGLGGQGDRRVFRQVEEPAHTRDELGCVLVGKAVVQAHHRPGVRHLGEMAGRGRADLRIGRIGSDQARKRGLDRVVAPDQCIIIGVGNLRRVLGVVELVVMRDLAGEPGQFGGCFLIGLRERVGQGSAHDEALAEAGWRFNDPHRHGSEERPDCRSRSRPLFLMTGFAEGVFVGVLRGNRLFFAW
ncbi:hypothetical protein MGWOODY_Smn1891 [hydrothermal vent metagenome]|uniref:Uncharacterized protein n=1 Tax=hydrothermal vent metagenome TaxID=652676 RepID=A0A160TL17_9ZZZZ